MSAQPWWAPLGAKPSGQASAKPHSEYAIVPLAKADEPTDVAIFEARDLGIPVKCWPYRNAAGLLVSVVARYETLVGKETRPWIHARKGGIAAPAWHMKSQPIPRALYQLPELLAAADGSTVMVAEGEKAADAAQVLFPAYAATTSVGGSSSAKASDWAAVRGRHVLILPDHDDAGRRYTADVARFSRAAGALSVRAVVWPDVFPERWDVADPLPDGFTADWLRDAVRDAPEAPAEASGAKPDAEAWGEPDMSVLRLARRSAPAFPTHALGPEWAAWVEGAAEAASAPVDYVALPLLAAASALIGHARWAEATPGWQEPPHIWAGVVGDSGSSKSPGADALLRDVLPKVEANMLGDFPDRLREWLADAELEKAKMEVWTREVKEAHKRGNAPPLPPASDIPLVPQAPRLRQSDVTIEKVASLLASAAPKGLLITRDELAGWLLGMTQYNDSGRAFWVEAYGGRPYRVERQKTPEPIVIPRLSVAVTGSTQPEKLATMFREADDGLLSRFIWGWPDPLPFRLGRVAPNVEWAAEALDRLRALEMASALGFSDLSPIMVRLVPDAVLMMEQFAADMQQAQADAGGLMRSAFGKARGLALRLGLVLVMLRWCGAAGMSAPPTEIDDGTFGLACDLVAEYFMPSAERVYGDAAASVAERNAATLARWIVKHKPKEIHVRKLQREIRLPGLGTAASIHAAADELTEADWLMEAGSEPGPGRPRAAYAVNPALRGAA